LGTNEDVKLDLGKIPEFDGWRWVDYWYPIDEVVSFKQEVYRNALEELAPLIQAPLAKQPHSAHS